MRAAVLARAEPARSVSFGEAFKFWLKLGFISFGGPASPRDRVLDKRRSALRRRQGALGRSTR